jgi:hypothetical protein
MGVKEVFFENGSFTIGNGQKTRFWEDTWLSDTPLAHQYPPLYNIVRRKNVLVADVLSNAPLNIEFRRTLTGNKWVLWSQLVQRLMGVTLNENLDTFVWKMTSSGLFSVKSLYAHMMNGYTIFLRKYIWKLKVPLKIKIFMWFLHRNVILTKDNLAKQNWNGWKKCADEVLTRQCPCLRAFDLWSALGIRRTRRLQTKTGGAHEFTQVRPPGG